LLDEEGIKCRVAHLLNTAENAIKHRLTRPEKK